MGQKDKQLRKSGSSDEIEIANILADIAIDSYFALSPKEKAKFAKKK